MKNSHANVALLVASIVAGTAVAHAASTPVAPAKAASPTAAVSAAAPSPNADADLALLQQHCATCHALAQVTARHKTSDEWAETMDRMVDHGMQISPDDSKKILDYLSAHYGTK